MPRQLSIHSVRGRMPVRYGIRPLMRALKILAYMLLAGWCIFVLFTRVHQDSVWWMKFIPLAVLFVALDTFLRQLTSLHSVIFTPQALILRYPLRPVLAIPYASLSSMELRKVITYYVFWGFTDSQGRQRMIKTQASFPKMLEIMYNIADLAPHIRLNEDLEKMIKVMRDVLSRQENPDAD